jgi:protein involved in polysaccharide export with SLBB domain
MLLPRRTFSLLLTLLAGLFLLNATSVAAGGDTPPTQPYRLGPEDSVRISVFDEPELTVEQRIDDTGRLRIPLLGEVTLSGMGVREAEVFLEKAFVEARMLRQPQVSVVITSFRVRNALVLGQVRSPGNISFPPNTEKIDIVQLITLAGGFTETARTSSVNVARKLPDGGEESFDVDVAAMLERSRKSGTRPEPVFILTGDRVTIPQRIF